MKTNKKLKRLIMGGIGFAMAGVVFFMGSMQSMQDVTADVRVFDKITKKYPYDGNFSMKVLEIVPNDPDNSKEIGYFLKKDNDKESPTDVSYGTVHSPIFTSRDDARYPEALYKLRTYGMIRPSGADATGIYPIYALGNASAGVPVFSNYETDTCKYPYAQSFVKGVYEMAAGDYNIATGYAIDGNGQICKVNVLPFVSGNGMVSENNPNYDSATNTIKEYIAVNDIDLTELSLPKSVSVNYITEAKEAGKGNVKFTRTESTTNKVQYYGYSDLKLYYMKMNNVKFQSSDYFKEYVLGSRTKYNGKQITYNTVQASAVTVDQVNEADLIYISGKSADFAKDVANDLKEDVMLAIYNKEVNEHKAVMMDYACYSADATTNVSKLAVLLWRNSQSEIAQTYQTAYTDEKNPTIMKNVDFMKGDALAQLKSTMETGANGNFVVGNVYVYNHHMSDFDEPKSMVDALDNFANGDFNTMYTTSVVQNGFSAVLSYITATNKNSTTGSMLPSVTPAVAIQYILISDGNPLTFMKNSLNVLEIQPVMSFLFNETRGSQEYGYLDDGGKEKTNRNYFINNYLSNFYLDKADDITFTSMTVDEFNGRNEDLIETYDIIYIGSEMGDFYYTASMKSAAFKDNKYIATQTRDLTLPTYTDTKMNGNVYYNIGDEVTVDGYRLGGFLDVDSNKTRFAGRDLTKDKLEKIKKFLLADGLVLVEGDILAEGKINPTAVDSGDHGRLDNASNMYELMQYGLGRRFDADSKTLKEMYKTNSSTTYYESFLNLVSVADLVNKTVDKVSIEKYVETEKLSLTLTEQPKPYSYTKKPNSEVIDKITYMDEKPDGTREMAFEFYISSDIGSVESSSYTPYLYVDINNDGKYSTVTENVKDVQIVVSATGEEAARDEENNYVLYKDVLYRMTRGLDESFSGFINWKLSVKSNLYENSYASETGSTVVKNATGKDELIQILQITAEDGASNLDLEDQENDVTSKYGKYLAAVPGYKVEIRTMTLSEYSNDFDGAWKSYKDETPDDDEVALQEYALKYFENVQIVSPEDDPAGVGLKGADMLVLGFGDDFASITSADAVTAIQSFMESEKPVLLAHDFIMYWSKQIWWDAKRPAYHNLYLRHNVGMDKYGVTQNVVTTIEDKVSVSDLVNATLFKDKGSKYLHSGVGYTRSANIKIVKEIEATGKAVAYQPGDARTSTLLTTQGLSSSVLMRWKTSDKSWLNKEGAEVVDYHGGGDYEVDKMNEGQITTYPYILPDNFMVNATHGQYFQLDLEADDDDDGESDVVVWYTLGELHPTAEDYRLAKLDPDTEGYEEWYSNLIRDSKKKIVYNPYSSETGGPIPHDGFYIYNKGNVTYTGAGHGNMADGTETEVQLFINTLFAAYNAAKVKPSVGFFEEVPDANDKPIRNLVIPYDENVSKDSSVLKNAQGDYRYQFVNPNVAAATMSMGTPMYFRLTDSNFVRGTKYMEIEYYLRVDGEPDDYFKLDNGKDKKIETIKYADATIPVVNISDVMTTYNVANKAFSSERSEDDMKLLESGVVYGFYLPLSYLKDESQITIYIKSKTRIHTVSSQTGKESVELVPYEGVSELTITKTDLLDLR